MIVFRRLLRTSESNTELYRGIHYNIQSLNRDYNGLQSGQTVDFKKQHFLRPGGGATTFFSRYNLPPTPDLNPVYAPVKEDGEGGQDYPTICRVNLVQVCSIIHVESLHNHIYIGLSGCMSVCLYSLNVKNKFDWREKVSGRSQFKNLSLNFILKGCKVKMQVLTEFILSVSLYS